MIHPLVQQLLCPGTSRNIRLFQLPLNFAVDHMKKLDISHAHNYAGTFELITATVNYEYFKIFKFRNT